MASIVHPAGIWSASDDENKSSGHGADAVSTRQASLQTETQHISTGQIISAKEDGKVPSAAIELTRMQTVRHAQAGRSSLAAGSSTGQRVDAGLAEEHGSPRAPVSQGVPPELPNLAAEIVFVVTCSGGQLVSALLIGHVTVTQAVFGDALGISPSQIPWLLGASMLPCGLSVVISGSLADLMPPKPLMVGAFLWESLWNAIAAAAISPRLKVLFFVARAMQGLAAGVLVSASMSILGRVYSPGIRKTRVFSLMAACSPLGYWLGCLLAGALSSHLPWIFGSSAILMAVLTIAAQLTIPPLHPAKDSANTEAPSLRHFDYIGAGLASVGCTLIIFGLTQGDSADWDPYTYTSIIVGFVMLGVFYFAEKRITRPLIPNRLWQTPGFGALLVSYFLGLGAYSKLYYPNAAPVILLISSDSRRRLAMVRHPVLAALSGCLAADNGPIHPTQRSRRHPRCICGL